MFQLRYHGDNFSAESGCFVDGGNHETVKECWRVAGRVITDNTILQENGVYCVAVDLKTGEVYRETQEEAESYCELSMFDADNHGKKIRVMLDSLEDGLKYGREMGGWIAHNEKIGYYEWFSLGWGTISNVMKAQSGDFTVDPWGKFEPSLAPRPKAVPVQK